MAGMGNYSMSVQNQNQTPSAYASMGQYANNNAAAALAQQVRADGSLYTVALDTANPVAFGQIVYKEMDALRSQQNSQYGNNLIYLQALLRGTGQSKGTSPMGILDMKDQAAWKNILAVSRAAGVDYFSVLEDYAKNGISGAGGGGGPKTTFSKDISTALNLIDKSDASTTFSKAYYTAFSAAPTSAQITNFMNAFNAKAKKEAVVTTRSGTTTSSTGGTSSKYTSKVSGQGFTAEEQTNFLASYLAKQYKISPETGGAAKVLLDTLRKTYKDNNLQEPSFETLAATVKDIVGTGDSSMAAQKLSEATQKIRNVAAKLNPGAADLLAAGDDLKTLADQYIPVVSKITGKYYDLDNPLIKQLINYKDEKGNVRNANASEALRIVQGSSDFMNSPAAASAFGSIGDSIISKMGLG
jgi:hypothetical protein